ncbi:hypothetical protein LO763_21985 [Glycomyces sp. A-F 0318]|uniref:Imm1 family immunity protein n=1 Tax=Glycomyces amatae TaxID=2881355 RepID=UPI001E3C5AD9|nr:Imm1 family immunity protein [Glycomyces amatae]MCD0446287.1 hypothetical protein [Glycomyces amatae]
MTTVEMTYPGASHTPIVCRSAQACVDVTKVFQGDDHYGDILQMSVQGSMSFMMEVVADERDGDGALKYFGPDGTWASKGTPTTYEVLEFNYFGTPHAYPTDALIPLDRVHAAVREFFDGAGARPPSVEWQQVGPVVDEATPLDGVADVSDAPASDLMQRLRAAWGRPLRHWRDTGDDRSDDVRLWQLLLHERVPSPAVTFPNVDHTRHWSPDVNFVAPQSAVLLQYRTRAENVVVVCESHHDAFNTLRSFERDADPLRVLEVAWPRPNSPRLSVLGLDRWGALQHVRPGGSWASWTRVSPRTDVDVAAVLPAEVPVDAVVSWELIETAFTEFLNSSGALPTAVNWQPAQST